MSRPYQSPPKKVLGMVNGRDYATASGKRLIGNGLDVFELKLKLLKFGDNCRGIYG